LGVAVVAAVGAALASDGTGSGSLVVAAVQGGGERGVRAVDANPRAVVDAHLAASRGIAPGSVALVLWPEDVVDLEGSLAGSTEEATLAALARELRATLVAGVVEEVDTPRRGFRNAAVVFGPDGTIVDRYDKVHRVPFGEYVPLRWLLDGIVDVSTIPRDAIAGRGAAQADTPSGRMAVTISYEVFFADRARSGVRAGGRLLLVPTNASSYTTSQVPSQEVAVARMRAVETGRWVVQAAPTGYSAVIDHRGRVRARSGLGSPAVLTEAVGLRTGRTLAVFLGEAPVVVLAALMVGGMWLTRRKA
ncbi:MAG: apolipoprotein N-acyltransferase, partial [Acidimicrobiales bacterium]